MNFGIAIYKSVHIKKNTVVQITLFYKILKPNWGPTIFVDKLGWAAYQK